MLWELPSFSGFRHAVFLQKKQRIFLEGEEKKLHWIIGRACRDLCIASAISFIGALIVGTLLSEIQYQLEMDLFRGVKLSQLVPILIFMISYIAYFGYRRENGKESTFLEWKDVRAVLCENIKVIYVILIAFFLIIGYVYIARTGHESSLQPLDIEMIARNFLEEKLLARPRTKEFLVAFPALMAGIYAAAKGYRWLWCRTACSNWTNIHCEYFLSSENTDDFIDIAYHLLIGVRNRSGDCLYSHFACTYQGQNAERRKTECIK